MVEIIYETVKLKSFKGKISIFFDALCPRIHCPHDNSILWPKYEYVIKGEGIKADDENYYAKLIYNISCKKCGYSEESPLFDVIVNSDGDIIEYLD